MFPDIRLCTTAEAVCSDVTLCTLQQMKPAGTAEASVPQRLHPKQPDLARYNPHNARVRGSMCLRQMRDGHH